MSRLFKDNVKSFYVTKRGVKLKHVIVSTYEAVPLPKKYQLKGDIRIHFIRVSKGTYILNVIEARGDSPYAENPNEFIESCYGTIKLGTKITNNVELKQTVDRIVTAFESTYLYEQEIDYEINDYVESRIKLGETQQIIWNGKSR